MAAFSLLRTLNPLRDWGSDARQVSHDWFRTHSEPIGCLQASASSETKPLQIMPIFRQQEKTVSAGNPALQSSVAGVPMAMSMMIDSMVHMVQNNRSEANGQGFSASNDQNEY